MKMQIQERSEMPSWKRTNINDNDENNDKLQMSLVNVFQQDKTPSPEER